MKQLFKNKIIGISMLCLQLSLSGMLYGQLSYKTTWVANSGGTWQTFTQMYMTGAGVSQSGISTGVCTWDEGGRGLGVYNTSGTVTNLEWDNRTGGTCVAINLKSVYTAMNNSIVKRPLTNTTRADKTITIAGISNVSKEPSAFSYDPTGLDILRKAIGITGVSANELFVTAAVYQLNKVFVYDAGLTLLRTINADRALYATPDNAGNVWIIQGADKDNAPIVREYNTSGQATGREIAGLSDPRSLQISKTGQLIIGDNGENQQVFFYNLSAAPELANTFGAKGGITSGIAGEVKPDKFNGIVYAGTDSLNNLYVVTNREGAIIRKFDDQLNHVWQKYGLAFVDMADADPDNETEIYSAEERYSMDYSKENGQEQEYRACLLNADKYPEDARLNASLDGGVWIRRINGQKIMFVGEMYSGFIFIYRFNETTDGEIAIPSGAIANHVSWQFGLNPWPPYQPAAGAFIWRDKNGNGRFDADEYESVNFNVSLANVDEKGNVFFGSSLDYMECQGLDEIGNPVYSFKNKVTQAVPDPFYLVKKVVYDNTRDIMYITGNSNDVSSTSGVGPVFAAYPNWSSANRKASFVKTFDANYVGFAAKSDYFFAAYGFDDNNWSIDVFSAKDGAKVGNLGTQQLQRFGWIDLPWGLIAEQRSNGEYLVFREDDWVAKTVIQRWNPYSADADAPTKPTSVQLVSKTSTSISVSWGKSTDVTGLAGYNVYANGIKTTPKAVWDTTYTITGLETDKDYTIYVAATDFAAHETNSDEISVKTYPADTEKPSAPANLSASDIAVSSFKISWNASSDNIGVTGYDVFLNNERVGNKRITNAEIQFSDLLSSHEYIARVVAFDYAGNSASSEITVTTLTDNEIPGPPQLIPTTQVSSSELAVIWSVSTDNNKVASYNIYNNGELLVENVSASQYLGIPISGDYMDYKIAGLQPKTTYNLTVKAVDQSGNLSNASNTIAMATDSVWSQLLDIEESDMSHMGHNFYYAGNINASGFVAGMMKQPGYVEWTVNIPTDTIYRFVTQYATMESFPYPMQIDANGEKIAEFTIRTLSGMTWATYASDPNLVFGRLKAGKNIIRLSSFAQYAPNMDLVKIMVSAPIYHVSVIALNVTDTNIFVGNKMQLIATVLPSNATNKKLSWKSSKPSVASVDLVGNVVAAAAGSATITATTEDGGMTATCLVKVGLTNGLLGSAHKSSVVVYPNPLNSERLSLESLPKGEKVISIASATGQVVITVKNDSDKYVFEDLKLQSGIYVITIKTKNTTESLKLIVD